ncbi:MAG: transposase [Eubacteriales bacterium]|nr:transposase [Eubacteriales bacterium]
MAQVHLTLEDEILKDLMLGNRENGVAKLLEKVFDAVLRGQASEQLNAEPYERSDGRVSYRNGYRERTLTTSTSFFYCLYNQLTLTSFILNFQR